MKKKLNIIYNPIDFEYVNKYADFDVGMLGFLKEGDKLIVGVGRLSEQKNFKVLIDAIAELVARDRTYKLIILGDGHLRDELELQITQRKLKDYVFLLGYKDNVFPYLRLADVFVLSSLYEGLPSVLIQAMLCNCRVVVSDTVLSGPEILNGESFGLYFKSGNSKHLAEKILEIEKSETVNSEKVDYLRENFSAAATIPKYMKVLGL
jgi:glycosyltransferase involved in cell wall biosynthesis